MWPGLASRALGRPQRGRRQETCPVTPSRWPLASISHQRCRKPAQPGAGPGEREAPGRLWAGPCALRDADIGHTDAQGLTDQRDWPVRSLQHRRARRQHAQKCDPHWWTGLVQTTPCVPSSAQCGPPSAPPRSEAWTDHAPAWHGPQRPPARLPVHQPLLLDDAVRLLPGDAAMEPVLALVNHWGEGRRRGKVGPGPAGTARAQRCGGPSLRPGGTLGGQRVEGWEPHRQSHVPVLREEWARGLWLPRALILVLRLCKGNATSVLPADGQGHDPVDAAQGVLPGEDRAWPLE